MPMLDRDQVLRAFHRALEEMSAEPRKGGLRPRAVAVRAHALYCLGLNPGEKKPAPETFRKFATGRLAIPEVERLLRESNVETTARARLDHERLRKVFQEAIQRLEARLVKGRTRPLQIARRAHEIYSRDAGDQPAPSPHTFQRLIYGKAADPEILSLIESALKKKGTAA